MSAKHPLGSLIEAVQRSNDWSDRDLEIRARGLSGVGKSNISKLKNHPLNSFKGQTLKNLASLLGIPERLVLNAAIASLDVQLDLDSEVGLLDVISADQRLADEDKIFLHSLVTRMYDQPGMSAARNSAGSPATLAGNGQERSALKTKVQTETTAPDVFEEKRLDRRKRFDDHLG